MKTIKYLSPTSLALYQEDSKDFYLAYLADNRPEKSPQTEPMAVGSAFDAFVKSYLYNGLFGKKDPRFELMAIFEAQVQAPLRDGAYKAGQYIFEQYKKAGCLSDLMLELNQSISEPRFEFDIMGQVAGYREGKESTIGPVTFMGKPDIYFTNKAGARVIFDWKVNGYYSKYTKYPMKGYVRCRDCTQNYGSHKEAFIQPWNGMKINVAHYLEQLDAKWAQQLAIYGWLCGEEVGTEMFIAGIDQVCCSPDSVRPQPKLKFAEHRLRIGKAHQHRVFEAAQQLWEIVHSDWFFRDLPKEVSQERCALLDTMVMELDKQFGGDNDDWFKRMAQR